MASPCTCTFIPDHTVRKIIQYVQHNQPAGAAGFGIAAGAPGGGEIEKLRAHLEFHARTVRPLIAAKYAEAAAAGGSAAFRAEGITGHAAPSQNIDQKIFNMNNSEDTDKLPGSPLDQKDPAYNKVHTHSQEVYRFFVEVLSRDSIDNHHMPLVSSVHFAKNYANAFWLPGNNQMVYGDGNPSILPNVLDGVDIFGHEMTHGIVSMTSNLEYNAESGALNEHCADVVGISLKHRLAGSTAANADWLIGKDQLPAYGGLKSLRSFKDEKASEIDDQPKSMAEKKKYLDDPNNNEAVDGDNGGVHIFSGVPNHAFYLFCKNLGDNTHSYDIPVKLWYATFTSSHLHSNANFSQFAKLTIQTAQQQYPQVVDSLKKAWTTVGVSI